MAEEEKEDKAEKDQDDEEAPPNPVVKAAQDEAALAKAQADKAKAEKEIIEHHRDKMKAELMPVEPSDKVTAPTGEVTTDAAGFVETQILGQEAARQIAKLLAEELMQFESLKTLIIYNAADVNVFTIYVAVLRELTEFAHEFDLNHNITNEYISVTKKVLKDPDVELVIDDVEPSSTEESPGLMTAIAAPSVITGIVKSVAELINLFRTTTEIKNKSLSGSEDLVLSYLIKEFSLNKQTKKIEVYSPALFPPQLLMPSGETELVKALKEIRGKRSTTQRDFQKADALASRITAAKAENQTALDIKIKEITAKGTELSNLPPDEPQYSALKDTIDKLKVEKQKLESRKVRYEKANSDLSDLKAATQLLITAAEQMLNSLKTPDPTTKQTQLSKFLVTAHLHQIMNNAETFTLRFTVASNGTTKIKKNLFWNAKVRHSAGASLMYQMFNLQGGIVQANAFQWYFEWKSSEEISAMVRRLHGS